MIAASVLGLPAIFLLITVLPCIRMGHEPGAAKYRRSQLGGILIILLGKARPQLGAAACPCPRAGQAAWAAPPGRVSAGPGALQQRCSPWVGKRHGQEWEDKDRRQG